MATLLPLYHTLQALLSLHPAFHTLNSIAQTMTYESRTIKAAKYSNTAEYHLWQTRKTLASGAIGVLASAVASISLIFKSYTSPSSSSSTSTDSFTKSSTSLGLSPLILSFALSAYLTFAHSYISNYWRGSAKVPIPGMGDYNKAISSTAGMRKGIGFLAISWGVVGGIYGWEYLF